MKTWIALLRGVNVGGNKKLPMKELTNLLKSNGFAHVKTYIQSGNIIFQHASKPEREIGDLIEKQFGFNPSVFMLSAEELEKAAMNNPYPTEIGKAVHFFFFHKQPETVDYELLDSLKATSEEYRLIDNVFYLYAPEGIGRSKMVEKMSKAFSKANITARNLNTISKICEMVR